MTKNKSSKHALPPFETIGAAATGDVCAINAILRHYNGYMHQLTGDFYTVGEILGHTLKGVGQTLGISANLDAVTARYVDVRLERKKEVIDAYHKAVHAADKSPKAEKTPKAPKKKNSDIDL